jgi:hypothetical protein
MYWESMKHDVKQSFAAFSNHTLDLQLINKANAIMIPKKEIPEALSDFCPISVINLFPKVLSKVPANILTLLPDLITNNQTAFIRDRHIAENFITSREILHHINASGNSTFFFMKINFAKAFDLIN